MPQTHEYDAIVVGSGITGGWAAKELCEAGLKTLVLERGRMVEHGKDYVGEHKANWELPFRNHGDRRLYEDEYFIQSKCYAFDEATKHFFVNDKENVYHYDEYKEFRWIRGYHLGGRSLMWARLCWRWSDLDFEANARDGHGVDWPIRYHDIAPWYDYVETFAGISGQAECLPQVPDGKFLPPMEMNVAERVVKDRIAENYSDRMMTIGRCAVLTREHNGRAPCHYCGPCHRGCSTGSYFSSLSATLPAAQATGNLTIRTDSIVRSIAYDNERGRASGVRVIDANTLETLEFKSRVVFLCASALGSTYIMLNSTSPRFPNGFANGSGELGHNLMDHHFGVGASGIVPGFTNKYHSGNRPNGVYVPRYQNLDAKTRRTSYLRGFGTQGSASRQGWHDRYTGGGIGVDLKEHLREPGPWKMRLGGFGEMLPRHDNYIDLDLDRVDKWGLPIMRIHCTFGENELEMQKAMKEGTAEMLETVGLEDVEMHDEHNPPGFGIHEMGTARMGRDPKTSVLNAWNQCYECENVFVTDGACMTSSACQNPSITYMALTARACNYAVEQMKKGAI